MSPVYCEPDDDDGVDDTDESVINREFRKYGLNLSDVRFPMWFLKFPHGFYRRARWLIQCGEFAQFQVEFAAHASFNPETGYLKSVLDRESSRNGITIFSLPTADSGVASGRSEDFIPGGYTSYMKRHNIGQGLKKGFISTVNETTGLTEPFKYKVPEFTGDGCKIEKCFFNPCDKSLRYRTMLMYDSSMSAANKLIEFERLKSSHRRVEAIMTDDPCDFGLGMHLGARSRGSSDQMISSLGESIKAMTAKSALNKSKLWFRIPGKYSIKLEIKIPKAEIRAFIGSDLESNIDLSHISGEFHANATNLGVDFVPESELTKFIVSTDTMAIYLHGTPKSQKFMWGDYKFESPGVFYHIDEGPEEQEQKLYLWVYKFNTHTRRNQNYMNWIVTDETSRNAYILGNGTIENEKNTLNIFLVSQAIPANSVADAYAAFDIKKYTWYERDYSKRRMNTDSEIIYVPIDSEEASWKVSSVQFSEMIVPESERGNTAWARPAIIQPAPATPVSLIPKQEKEAVLMLQTLMRFYILKFPSEIRNEIFKQIVFKNRNLTPSFESRILDESFTDFLSPFKLATHNERFSDLVEHIDKMTSSWNNPFKTMSLEMKSDYMSVFQNRAIEIDQDILTIQERQLYSVLDEYTWNSTDNGDSVVIFQGGFTPECSTEFDYYLASIWVSILVRGSGFVTKEYERKFRKNELNKSLVNGFYVPLARSFENLKLFVVGWIKASKGMKILRQEHRDGLRELENFIETKANFALKNSHKYLIATALNLEITEYENSNGIVTTNYIGFDIMKRGVSMSLLNFNTVKNWAPKTPVTEYKDVLNPFNLSWVGSQNNFHYDTVKPFTRLTNPTIHNQSLKVGNREMFRLFDILSKYPRLGIKQSEYYGILGKWADAAGALYKNDTKRFNGCVLVDWKTYRRIMLMRSVISYHLTALTPRFLAEIETIRKTLTFLWKYDPVNDSTFANLPLREQWLVYINIVKRKALDEISPAEFQILADTKNVRITVLEYETKEHFEVPVLIPAFSFFNTNLKEKGTEYLKWVFSPTDDVDERNVSDIVLSIEERSYRTLTNSTINADNTVLQFVKKATPDRVGMLETGLDPVGFFDMIADDYAEADNLRKIVYEYLNDKAVPDDKKMDLLGMYRGKHTFEAMGKKEVLQEKIEQVKSALWHPIEFAVPKLLDFLCRKRAFSFIVVLGWNYITQRECTFTQGMTLDVYRPPRERARLWEFGSADYRHGRFLLYEENQLRAINMNKDEQRTLMEYLKSLRPESDSENGENEGNDSGQAEAERKITTFDNVRDFQSMVVNKTKRGKDESEQHTKKEPARIPKPPTETKDGTWAGGDDEDEEMDFSKPLIIPRPFNTTEKEFSSGLFLGGEFEYLDVPTMAEPLKVDILFIENEDALGPRESFSTFAATSSFRNFYNRSVLHSYRPLIRTNELIKKHEFRSALKQSNFKLTSMTSVGEESDCDIVHTIANYEKSLKKYKELKKFTNVSFTRYEVVEVVTSDSELYNMDVIRCLKSWFGRLKQDISNYEYLSPEQLKLFESVTSSPRLPKTADMMKTPLEFVDFNGLLLPENINLKTLRDLVDIYLKAPDTKSDKTVYSINKDMLELMKRVKDEHIGWPSRCGRDWEEIAADTKLKYSDAVDSYSKNQRYNDIMTDITLIGSLLNVKFNMVERFPQHDMNSLVEIRDSIQYNPIWTDAGCRWIFPKKKKFTSAFDVATSAAEEVEPFQIPILLDAESATMSYFVYKTLDKGTELYPWQFKIKDSKREESRKQSKAKKEITEKESKGGGESSGGGGGGGQGGGKKGGKGGGGGVDYGGQTSDGSGGGGGGGVSGSSNNECTHFNEFVANGGDPRNYNKGDYYKNNDYDQRDSGYEDDGSNGPRPKSQGQGSRGHKGRNQAQVQEADGFYRNESVNPGNAAQREKNRQAFEAQRQREEDEEDRTGFYYKSKFSIGAPSAVFDHPAITTKRTQYNVSELDLFHTAQTHTYAQGITKELYLLTGSMGSMMMNTKKLNEGAWATTKYHLGQSEEARLMSTIFAAFFEKAKSFPISKSYTPHLQLSADGFKAEEARKHNLIHILESCAGLNVRTLSRARNYVRDLEIIPKKEFDSREDNIAASSQKLFVDWFMQYMNNSKAHIQSTFQGRVTASRNFLTPKLASMLNKQVFDRVPESMREENKNALIMIAGTPYGQQLRPLFDILFIHPKSLLGTGFKLSDFSESGDSDEDDFFSFPLSLMYEDTI